MALVKFKRVTDLLQASEAIENGKILYNYESKKIFIDENGLRNEMYSFIGVLSSLTTTVKTSIVEAINELNASIASGLSGLSTSINTTIGSLANLTTTDKTSVVNSINEVVATTKNATTGTKITMTGVQFQHTFVAPSDGVFEYVSESGGTAEYCNITCSNGQTYKGSTTSTIGSSYSIHVLVNKNQSVDIHTGIIGGVAHDYEVVDFFPQV